jgi:hypothetical protein
VCRAASLIVLPETFGDDFFDWANRDSSEPPAPMAKAAAPVIAVLLKNFLRDIPVPTSFDHFIADSPHCNHMLHPADPRISQWNINGMGVHGSGCQTIQPVGPLSRILSQMYDNLFARETDQ